jgi:hypothetical protein
MAVMLGAALCITNRNANGAMVEGKKLSTTARVVKAMISEMT